MAVRKNNFLDLELLCPLSGARLRDPKTRRWVNFKKHKMQVRIAKNGGYYANCRVHVIRVFINGEKPVRMIEATSKVL